MLVRPGVLGRASLWSATLPSELFRLVQQHHRRCSRQYASVSASQLQFGQPVFETHPHILKAGESSFPRPSLRVFPLAIPTQEDISRLNSPLPPFQ